MPYKHFAEEQPRRSAAAGWAGDSHIERKAPPVPACFSRRFELGKFLGKGGYGDVWECRDKASKELCACKVFNKAASKTKEEKAALQKEILILRALKGQHKGLVQLKDVMEGDEATVVVMEYCQGGDLFELIRKKGKIPELSAKLLFRQLASALRFCHSNGVVHRDIKLENILLSRPADSLYDAAAVSVGTPSQPQTQTKVADFGLSVVLEPGDTTSGHVGSKFYTAPEMLQGKRYGRRVDIWSLGVVLCAMLTGKLPFVGKPCDDEDGVRKAILRGKVHFESSAWDGISEDAKGLTRKMLELEPKFRIRACELLVHPWLAETCNSSSLSSLNLKVKAMRVRSPQSMEVPATAGSAVGLPGPKMTASMCRIPLQEDECNTSTLNCNPKDFAERHNVSNALPEAESASCPHGISSGLKMAATTPHGHS